MNINPHLKRIWNSGYQSFVRNKWLSMAAITTTVLSIMILTGLLLLNYGAVTFSNEIKNKVDVSIYFKPNVDETEILKIQEELGKLKEVSKVEYVSKAEALEKFKKMQEKDKVILQALEEIGENPLSASLNVKAKNSEDYNTIINYIENSLFKDKLLNIDFSENRSLIESSNNLIRASRLTILLLTIVLGAVAVIVTFNTIGVAIYSVREEIKIMNLVGASPWFIKGPFLIEGVIYGVISAIISLLIYIPLIWFVGSKIDKFLGFVSITNYFFSHILIIFLWQLLFGVGLGVISSLLATNKYLKQIE